MSHIVKMLSERKRVYHQNWCISFTSVEDESFGYSFPCKNGKLDTEDENYESRKDNYEYCCKYPEEYINNGIVDGGWWYTEPSVGLCSCGEEVRLVGDCQCLKCEQWYNGFGQALKNPEFWGKEYDY